MTERRRRKRKEEDEQEEEEDEEPSDEQTEVAKYLRFNCSTKSSNYHNEKVEYFKESLSWDDYDFFNATAHCAGEWTEISFGENELFVGSKAIECLLDSKWASGKKGAEILFTDRNSVQDYLQILLELGMFKRITRVRKKKKGDKDEGKKTKDGKDSPKPSKSQKDSSEGASEGDSKKKKVKVKLELHEFQVFLDGEEVYMWIYDPVHPRTIIYGVLVVIAAIILCLFPLWPMQMREYVWYLSVGAAVLLGALIVVALLRYVIFAAVWLLTVGRHHFWLLPNLTEDCGVLESFVPLYMHTYIKSSEDSQEEKDNEENGKDNENKTKEGPTDANKDDSPETSKETTGGEAEPWVQVTPEDIAQAKQATDHDTETPTTDTQVAC